MLKEIVVADGLNIEPLDQGESITRIGSAKIVVRIRDNRMTAMESDQKFFAADEAARTRL
ncbi:hypothetical protein LNAOJCKE_3371 [Methylorubrum aminovorans]|uniref:Uncharacterized protein n=1 Tax=Methylorubrum aminovorans TaxID=269069 RepID=A0ABQ4UHJ3_9HYPH|nr:hypothetical protein [Methylorubrum aminovorans]GJE66156.1 hypothetical protein LNAOJCKE_3371 [Methylorubrum aminovorans]GMA76393.1 hypothetical protein GCM10025880_28100 [Methylorubrum aminovorans]